jgi:NAD(P)-dependent dehydrogenase (short-subunit alcohol dehydrogenase family)
MSLIGRHCVVTGAAGDIGAATIERMVRAGARVTAVDRDQIGLDGLARSHSSEVLFAVRADVAVEDEVKGYADSAFERFGPVSVFFNNAAIEGDSAPIVDYDVNVFVQVLAVNVVGVFLGLKHVIPKMVDGGSIIITSSMAGLRAGPNMSAYTASKHAVLGLTRTAAVESMSRRIRVNAIHPTAVEGGMMQRIAIKLSTTDQPDLVREQIAGRIGFERFVEADEVAASVMFLASDDGRMITGSSLPIDGGWT